jgi:hypothetical protein
MRRQTRKSKGLISSKRITSASYHDEAFTLSIKVLKMRMAEAIRTLRTKTGKQLPGLRQTVNTTVLLIMMVCPSIE